jgi:tetratricopeptide (TPR) repeat protein
MKTKSLFLSAVALVAAALSSAAAPSPADAPLALALAALSRGEVDEAITQAEKAAALAPDRADCQHTLGDVYGTAAQKAGMFRALSLGKKVIAAYERAVALAPDSADYRESLFEVYRQAPGFMGGGADKARAEATVLAKLDPRRGRLAFAALHAGEKNYPLARQELDEVLKQTPDDYAALYQYGRLAAITGESLDRGEAALRHCLELTRPAGAPDHAAAHWRLGNILEKKGNPAGARAAYETSLKLKPDFSEAADSLKQLK